MKKKFTAPRAMFVGFSNQLAFAKRCNFACARDDCSNQQYK